jgi:hypothetical protein
MRCTSARLLGALVACSLIAHSHALRTAMRMPAPRQHTARAGSVVALAPEVVHAFQPQLDYHAAIGCFVSLSPIVLALHWGIEFNAASDRAAVRRAELRAEYEACLRGEGCPIAYEEARAACEDALAELEAAKVLQLAGATQAVALPLLTRALRPEIIRRRISASPSMQTETESVEATTSDEAAESSGSASLDAKMQAWEATEEEARAKTLGGNLPFVGMPGLPNMPGLPGRMTRTDQPEKMDGFDLGMNISGIILFPLAILLFCAPFWLGSMDMSDLPMPPTS